MARCARRPPADAARVYLYGRGEGVMLSDAEIERLAERLAPRLAAMMRAPVTDGDLLSIDEIATALGVGEQSVRRRMVEGMPVVYVGDLPRFDLAECRAWLAAQPRQQKHGPPASATDMTPARRCTRLRREA